MKLSNAWKYNWSTSSNSNNTCYNSSSYKLKVYPLNLQRSRWTHVSYHGLAPQSFLNSTRRETCTWRERNIWQASWTMNSTSSSQRLMPFVRCSNKSWFKDRQRRRLNKMHWLSKLLHWLRTRVLVSHQTLRSHLLRTKWRKREQLV